MASNPDAAFVVRRCNGNRDMWLICRLRDDSAESNLGCDRTTSSSVDGAIRRAIDLGLIPPGHARIDLQT